MNPSYLQNIVIINTSHMEASPVIRYSPLGITMESVPGFGARRDLVKVQKGEQFTPPYYSKVKMIFKKFQRDLSSTKAICDPIALDSASNPESAEIKSPTSNHIYIDKVEKFKKARQKRLRKMQNKRLLKKNQKEWATFTNGVTRFGGEKSTEKKRQNFYSTIEVSG